MGPGIDYSDYDSRFTKYHAPKLGKSPTSKELREWRINVATWYKIVATAYGKDNSDPKLKEQYALLPLHLFSTLTTEHQRIVEGPNRNKQINILRSEVPLNDVLCILNCIARESPTSYVTRIIKYFHDITKCFRKDREQLNQFHILFLALANDYLEACNQTNRSQVSSILAMFLLVNARLPNHLLFAAKHDLSTKNSSSVDTATDIVSVIEGNIDSVSQETSKILEIESQIPSLKLDSSST